jgi:AraC-like DNA-binding protein
MAVALPLNRFGRLDLRDRDESLALTGEVWEPHKGQLLNGRFRLRWNQFNLSRSAIGALDFGSTSLIEAEPKAPVYRVCMPLAGSIQHTVEGVEAVSVTHTAVVHRPRAALKLLMTPQTCLFAGFEEAAVDAAIRARLGDDWAGGGLAIAIETNRGRGAAFRSFVNWLTHEIDADEQNLGASPKSIAAMDATLLELFVDALVSSEASADEKRFKQIGEFRLRQLLDWIDGNLGEAFGMTELAVIARTDVRAVRDAFRRHRNMSPTEYVMNRRLERARNMLEHAAADVTVTSVCVACGLFHFGRFSARYKQRFGEAPSQTLARSAEGRRAAP